MRTFLYPAPGRFGCVRRLIAGRAPILTKLEKPAAIDGLDEIIELNDAVMVARGDLGVEMPPEDVPVLQRQITVLAGKPGGDCCYSNARVDD